MVHSEKRLFNQKLLRQRRINASKTFYKAAYLSSDMEKTLIKRLPPLTGKEKVLLLGGPSQILSQKLHSFRSIELDVVLLENFSEEQITPLTASYDLIIDAFLFHWINDPIQYLLCIKKALRAGGLYLSGFLGGKTLTELRHALIQTDLDLLKGACARVSPMIPAEAATRLLHATGFRDPVVDHDEVKVIYPHLSQLIQDLRNMGETNALSEPPKIVTQKTYFSCLEHHYRTLTHYHSQGPNPTTIQATFDFIFMSGLKG